MIRHLLKLAKYNRILFLLVVFAIIAQLYFNLQFGLLCKYVDNNIPTPHPYCFESFPFVTYNMYSGKIKDWYQYRYLRIEVDSAPLLLTELPAVQASQIVNPLHKYLSTESTNFNEPLLQSLLYYDLDSSALGNKIYLRVSNTGIDNCREKWSQWLTRYISSIAGKEAHSIKIFSCEYKYDIAGRPYKINEKMIFQSP